VTYLDQRLAERSPHERVDDWVDTRVDVRQDLSGRINQQSVVDIAVSQHDVVQLIWQPSDGERRRNCYAHPGDFARCLLLGR